MSVDEFLWRTVVLATVNAVFMWLAIKLFDFGNVRNRLPAAILWSIPISALVHVGFRFGLIFYILAMMIFYAALLKWYDLEIGQTIKVAILTLGADVGGYIALSRVGILPPFETASLLAPPLFM